MEKLFITDKQVSEYQALLIDENTLFQNGKFNNEFYHSLKKNLENKTIIYISNTIKSAKYIKDKLDSLGIFFDEANILTSGDLAKKMLLDNKHPSIGKYPSIYNLGDRDYLDDSPEILSQIRLSENILDSKILLLTKSNFSYSEIDNITQILKECAANKLPAICADPTEQLLIDSQTLYFPGYLAKLYENFGGSVFYNGLPHRVIFFQALIKLAKLNLRDKSDILFITKDSANKNCAKCLGFDIGILYDSKIIEILDSKSLLDSEQSNTNLSLKVEICEHI